MGFKDDIERAGRRVAEDIEKVGRGDFNISQESKEWIARSLRDNMEGRQSLSYDFNDRVSVEASRKDDGDVRVSFRYKF